METPKISAAWVAVILTILMAVGGLITQAYRLGSELAETRTELAATREALDQNQEINQRNIDRLQTDLHGLERWLLDFMAANPTGGL